MTIKQHHSETVTMDYLLLCATWKKFVLLGIYRLAMFCWYRCRGSRLTVGDLLSIFILVKSHKGDIREISGCTSTLFVLYKYEQCLKLKSLHVQMLPMCWMLSLESKSQYQNKKKQKTYLIKNILMVVIVLM